MVKIIENRNNMKMLWEKSTLQKLDDFVNVLSKKARLGPFAMDTIFLPMVNLYITIAYY